MAQRDRVALALAMTMALAAGCFQEEAPRLDAPPTIAARPTDPRVGNEPAFPVNEEIVASVPKLAQMLQDERDPDVRRQLVYAIADAGERDDAAIIGQALTDPDSGVREAAIEALTGFGGESSADWLSLGLGDPDPGIRRTAVEALGEIGGDTAQFLLQQALADVDPDVREAAQQMLDEPVQTPGEFR
jgi:HEAT repeat protein